jgi:hypothetical protein
VVAFLNFDEVLQEFNYDSSPIMFYRTGEAALNIPVARILVAIFHFYESEISQKKHNNRLNSKTILVEVNYATS